MTSRIGQYVAQTHDTARVGQVVALVRGRPERVIVCWSSDHQHDDSHTADCTVEHIDQLTPRIPAVRS